VQPDIESSDVDTSSGGSPSSLCQSRSRLLSAAMPPYQSLKCSTLT
jgi:hypothetical protein